MARRIMAVLLKASIFKGFVILLLISFMLMIYCFYGVLKQRTISTKLPFEDGVHKLPVLLLKSSEDKYASESHDVSSIQSSQPKILSTTQMDAGQTENWPVIKINQSMEFSIVDALRMSLTCTATVGKNNLIRYDMRWSGMNLDNSLWIQQSHVKKEGDYIEKKLFFKPWLDSLAGEYTCHLFVKNHPHATAYNRSHVIGGNFRGLINSRNTSQKFENTLPSKWFPNANLCGGDNIWNEYADFHKSVLSGKEKQRYLKYSCTHKTCGGYGNRIGGIAVLLIYAMFTKRALLLDMTVPVDINLYLLPNGVEWNHIVPKGLTTQDFNLINSKNFLQYVKTFEEAVLGDQYDIVNVQINFGLFYFVPKMSDNLVHYMITMLNLRTHYDLVLLYGCTFHYLFKYQPKTIKAIDALQYELGLETGKYVAMHVRSHIGEVYHPLNLKYERMFECAAEAAKSMSHKLNVPKVPIFLAADHPQVTQYAIEHYKDNIVLSKAPLFHIDLTKYTGGNATNQYDSGMIGLFSDIEICSRAGVVIRSAFSTMSEVIGAINFPSPKRHLHPFYFYNDLSACQQ